MPSTLVILSAGLVAGSIGVHAAQIPAAAQIVDQKTFNVLSTVGPPVEANDSTVCL